MKVCGPKFCSIFILCASDGFWSWNFYNREFSQPNDLGIFLKGLLQFMELLLGVFTSHESNQYF